MQIKSFKFEVCLLIVTSLLSFGFSLSGCSVMHQAARSVSPLSRRQSKPFRCGLSSLHAFAQASTASRLSFVGDQDHRPFGSPPFYTNHSNNVDPPPLNRTTSIRPDPSSLDDAFLDSSKARSNSESRGAIREVEESLQTYRDKAPFDCRRTPSNLSFDRAKSTRNLIRLNPPGLIDGEFADSIEAQNRLVDMNEEEMLKQSFDTYLFPFGSDGAETNSRRSCCGPPSEPVIKASTSRQSRFHYDNYEEEDTFGTYHDVPPRDVRVSKHVRSQLCQCDLEMVFCDATKAPDEKYLIGRLQVDHYLESFENANHLADYIDSYQLSLAKLRERAIEFDLKDSTNVYSTFNMQSSVV